MTLSSDDQYAHLRANAAVQKQTTVDRLSQAITLLEAEGRAVNTFTIKEMSGLDYMAYYCQVPRKLNIKIRVDKEQSASHACWHSDRVTADLIPHGV